VPARDREGTGDAAVRTAVEGGAALQGSRDVHRLHASLLAVLCMFCARGQTLAHALAQRPSAAGVPHGAGGRRASMERPGVKNMT
jgi:hypothetical protein